MLLTAWIPPRYDMYVLPLCVNLDEPAEPTLIVVGGTRVYRWRNPTPPESIIVIYFLFSVYPLRRERRR